MNGSVRSLAYPARSLYGDYVRAGVGIVLTAGPLALIPGDSAAVWVFTPLVALFGVFGLRTAIRHTTRVELSDEGISLFGPGRASLIWGKLAAVKLSYYSTATDRHGGWMQLTLKGAGGGTIRLDSTIDGFVDIARRTARAALDNGLTLSAATSSNFQALGIHLDSRPGAT